MNDGLLPKSIITYLSMRNGQKTVLVVNGPNLNMLGLREPAIYGYGTLDDVVSKGSKQAEALHAQVDFFQRSVGNRFKCSGALLVLITRDLSNWEGAIIDRIQKARLDGTDGIVINPGKSLHPIWATVQLGRADSTAGGLTHTSVPVRDALLSVEIPFIELHVSNVHSREPWRHHSYFSDKAKAIIVRWSSSLEDWPGYKRGVLTGWVRHTRLRIRDRPCG
jgi:3-dehydroquinate dehydratase II